MNEIEQLEALRARTLSNAAILTLLHTYRAMMIALNLTPNTFIMEGWAKAIKERAEGPEHGKTDGMLLFTWGCITGVVEDYTTVNEGDLCLVLSHNGAEFDLIYDCYRADFADNLRIAEASAVA